MPNPMCEVALTITGSLPRDFNCHCLVVAASDYMSIKLEQFKTLSTTSAASILVSLVGQARHDGASQHSRLLLGY